MRQVVMILLSIIIFGGATTSFAGNCGDVDGVEGINILDIVHLINYKYKEGPPPDCYPVTDYDGNVYRSVTIGNQVWMAENLKVTHYRNGDPIPFVTDGGAWAGLATGAYCEYDNNVANVATYGRLYNLYAAVDPRNIAPEGWHVPSDDEWKQLEMYLGMNQVEADIEGWRGTDEGGKLKEVGTTHWNNPNEGATNETGFSALPGALRSNSGDFYDIGIVAYIWSSTEIGGNAWRRGIFHYSSWIHRGRYFKRGGFSIRCVKD